MTGAGGYDPVPDLISYMVASRRSRTVDAGQAQRTLMERIGITNEMDPDEAGKRIRHAIEQAREQRGEEPR